MADFDTSELRKLAADLGSAAPRTGRKVSTALRASAERVKKAGAVNAPKGETGNLSRSVGFDMYGDGRSRGITAVIGPSEFYGRFVENGTTRMPAQPFMEPALRAEEPKLIKALEDAAGEVLDP